MNIQATPPITRRLVSVEEAAAAIGIGRTFAFALIGSGALRSVRVGKRRLVPVEAIDAYVDALATGAA